MEDKFIERLSDSEGKFEKFEVAAESVPSENHPERNEDAYLIDEERGLFAVFDGMGGYAAGEVASFFARDYVSRFFAGIAKNASVEDLKKIMESVLGEVNKQIIQKAEAEPEKYEDMGTTASVVKIWESKGKRKAIIGNVGDSRVYQQRTDGNLEEVTLDDSYFASSLDEGEARRVQEKLSRFHNLEELDEREKSFFNFRNVISQALGRRGVRPRIEVIEINSGDKILITSDGIHDNLTDNEIERILKEFSNPQSAAYALIGAAQTVSRNKKNPRAKADDMTAVILSF